VWEEWIENGSKTKTPFEKSFRVIYPSRRLCQRYAPIVVLIVPHYILQSFHHRAYLLGSDLGVLLDGDLVVRLKGGDEVVGELSTVQASACGHVERHEAGSENVREALDQLELVCDLAALGLDILLGLLEVLVRGLGLEGNLWHESVCALENS
jgi:hypothetical protein